MVRLPVVALLALACGTPDVLEAERFNYDGSPSYHPCKATSECPSGQTCVQGLCRSGSTSGADTSAPPAPDTATPPPVPDAGPVGSEDIVADGETVVPPAADTVGEADVADVAEPPDPGPAPDPGPPPATDACLVAGTSQGCDSTLFTCRVSLETHALECIGSTLGKPFGAPCTSHEECDLNYGCHFGKCTTYCELAFGAGQCTGGACVGVGHKVFGACQFGP